MGKNRIICDSTLACLVVQSGKTVVTFNKRTGWIDYLDIDGKPMLEKGYAIRPDFWRAPTDKDYGAGYAKDSRVWCDPMMKLVRFDYREMENGAEILAEYDLPDVASKLKMTYMLASDG